MLLPPWFCSTSPMPARPVTDPPRRYELVVHLTEMLVTLAETVPEALLTVQVCAGFTGCAAMVTE